MELKMDKGVKNLRMETPTKATIMMANFMGWVHLILFRSLYMG